MSYYLKWFLVFCVCIYLYQCVSILISNIKIYLQRTTSKTNVKEILHNKISFVLNYLCHSKSNGNVTDILLLSS